MEACDKSAGCVPLPFPCFHPLITSNFNSINQGSWTGLVCTSLNSNCFVVFHSFMRNCCIYCRNTLMPEKILRVFVLKSATNSEELQLYKKFLGLFSWESKIMSRFWKGSQNKKSELHPTEYTGFHENSPHVSAASWMSLAREYYTWVCTFLSTCLCSILSTNLLKAAYLKLNNTSFKLTCLSKDKYYLNNYELWLWKFQSSFTSQP